MSDFIILKNCRLAYPNFKVARAQQGDDGKPGIPKYDGVLLIDPTTPAGAESFNLLKQTIIAVAKAKWGDQHAQILPMLRDQKRLCYNEGPHYAKDGSPRAGWEGMVAVNVFRYADRGAPGLFDGGLNPLGDDTKGVIYAGCYVNGKINVFAWDHPKYGKRVRAEILAVQFVRDGDAFTSGSAPDAAGFESLATSEAGAGAEGFASVL